MLQSTPLLIVYPIMSSSPPLSPKEQFMKDMMRQILHMTVKFEEAQERISSLELKLKAQAQGAATVTVLPRIVTQPGSPHGSVSDMSNNVIGTKEIGEEERPSTSSLIQHISRHHR